MTNNICVIKEFSYQIIKNKKALNILSIDVPSLDLKQWHFKFEIDIFMNDQIDSLKKVRLQIFKHIFWIFNMEYNVVLKLHIWTDKMSKWLENLMCLIINWCLNYFSSIFHSSYHQIIRLLACFCFHLFKSHIFNKHILKLFSLFTSCSP